MEDIGAFLNAADYSKILFTGCTWAEDVGSTKIVPRQVGGDVFDSCDLIATNPGLLLSLARPPPQLSDKFRLTCKADIIELTFFERVVVYHDIAHACQPLRGGLFPTVPGNFVMDGEPRSLFRLVPPCEDELPEQVVQREPEEVRELAKDDTPPQGWWPATHAKDIVARVRLEVSDEAAVFTPNKPRDFVVEGVQLLVCSPNLEPAAM